MGKLLSSTFSTISKKIKACQVVVFKNKRKAGESSLQLFDALSATRLCWPSGRMSCEFSRESPCFFFYLFGLRVVSEDSDPCSFIKKEQIAGIFPKGEPFGKIPLALAFELFCNIPHVITSFLSFI